MRLEKFLLAGCEPGTIDHGITVAGWDTAFIHLRHAAEPPLPARAWERQTFAVASWAGSPAGTPKPRNGGLSHQARTLCVRQIGIYAHF
jgi:hypothetical protein